MGDHWHDGIIFVSDRDVQDHTTRTLFRVVAYVRRRAKLRRNNAAAHEARRDSILKTIGGIR